MAFIYDSEPELTEALEKYQNDNDIEDFLRVTNTFNLMIDQIEYNDSAVINDWLGLDEDQQYMNIRNFRKMFEILPTTYSLQP